MVFIKTVGIICEYNPFHNGHKYHIEQAKKLTGASAAVCVMSGNFVQRGECAICSKFTRAKAAVLGGADLVIELPVVYSLSCAEKFALGAVEILDKTGVDFICFGGECDDINKLYPLRDILLNETKEFKSELKALMSAGESYQTALCLTVSKLYGVDATYLSQPNNTLAVEYLKALKKLNSKITPVLIKRIGAGYNDQTPDENAFSSATAIRNFIKSKNRYDFEKNIFEKTISLYDCDEKLGKFPVFSSDLDSVILYRLRTMDKNELKQINDVSEGIENRIIACAKQCSSFEELLTYASSKRYTKRRIARIAMCALLNIKKSDVTAAEYVRPLAFNETGAKVLKQIKKNCPLPVVTKISKKAHNFNMLKFDIAASDIYALAFKKDRAANADFFTSPALIEKNEENFVYIVRCSDNTYYTGWTNDLNKRIADHNAKRGAKYTKSRTPVVLEYFETYQTKSQALKREFEIKQLSRAQKEKLIKP